MVNSYNRVPFISRSHLKMTPSCSSSSSLAGTSARQASYSDDQADRVWERLRAAQRGHLEVQSLPRPKDGLQTASTLEGVPDGTPLPLTFWLSVSGGAQGWSTSFVRSGLMRYYLWLKLQKKPSTNVKSSSYSYLTWIDTFKKRKEAYFRSMCIHLLFIGAQQQSSTSSSHWPGVIVARVLWWHQLPRPASLPTLWHRLCFLCEGWTEKQPRGEGVLNRLCTNRQNIFKRLTTCTFLFYYKWNAMALPVKRTDVWPQYIYFAVTRSWGMWSHRPVSSPTFWSSCFPWAGLWTWDATRGGQDTWIPAGPSTPALTATKYSKPVSSKLTTALAVRKTIGRMQVMASLIYICMWLLS